ncbi:hypothetical protein ACHAXS_000317, partial [Conticribra weissflogii]
MNNNNPASIVLVGCGAPLKSMGWYHATQLLNEDSGINARLEYVVEPWFLSDPGKSTPGYDEFIQFKENLETTKGIQFFQSVEKVPPLSDSTTKRIAIISARTSSNPSLFASCLSIGCTAIFLEKPGAPSVSQLEQMALDAKDKNVQVFMGFNKNVSKYVSKTREFASSHSNKENIKITFVHNNNYENTPEALGECFERNAEGMLKNMAIHELALLVTFYNVTVDTIDSVVADEEYSSCQTLIGPSSGEEFTDFDKLKFRIMTKDGVRVSIMADRCGGDDSIGIVTAITELKGKEDEVELARFSMPDEDDATTISNAERRIPGAMPYFYVQDPDYLTLKQRVVKA